MVDDIEKHNEYEAENVRDHLAKTFDFQLFKKVMTERIEYQQSIVDQELMAQFNSNSALSMKQKSQMENGNGEILKPEQEIISNLEMQEDGISPSFSEQKKNAQETIKAKRQGKAYQKKQEKMQNLAKQ